MGADEGPGDAGEGHVRSWTVDEANAALSWVGEVVARAQAEWEDYRLCWLAGEDAVTWWHWPEDGFGGRTRLTDPPA